MSVTKMDLKKVINASGKMSTIGVSTITDDVIHAMEVGGKHFYEMEDLQEKSGEIVAEYMRTESALITNSASSALVLAVAGLITENDSFLAERMHAEPLHKEILLMKGHMIDYGAPVSTMVALGGGHVREVGYANGCRVEQMEAAINENTAGILFVQSHHCVQKNMPTLDRVSELARRVELPLIVDIAAEEDISGYSDLADLIILSGSKALEGPTSGILAGKEQYLEYVKPHLKGIGRAMKIGKESIFGLLQALETYTNEGMSKQNQVELLNQFFELENLAGVKVAIHQDESGRHIYRARIELDESKVKHNALYLTQQLKQGDIAIYTRDYNANIGYFDIDPRALSSQEVDTMIARIKQILGG